ncbi:MAG: hypothetical protein OXT67_11165, partial [Zetaproteobacteria bacterium]|nr:hypothetical protein [Zetaproteobacteria bacterium]
GYISAQGSSQDALSGWVIAILDAESQIARIATINEQGVFTLPHVYENLLYTLALFSPSMSLRAVLSQPVPTKDGVVDQYFTLEQSVGNLPPLVLQGNVLQWSNQTGITLSGRETADANTNDVPDGVESTLSGTTALQLSSADTDADGIPNSLDADIDGDGLINVLDPDDDGDSTDDSPNDDGFDSDSDGDLTTDSKAARTDLHFSRGAEFIALRVDWAPPTSGTGWEIKLLFQLKQQSQDAQPETISTVKVFKTDLVSLLSNSVVTTTDADGNSSSTTWDGTLADDGNSEDGSATDGLWGKQVTLATNKSPAANQMFGLQIEYGSGWSKTFLYTMPAVTPASFTPTYDATTRTITFRGSAGTDPFVSQNNYKWVVRLFEVDSSNSSATTQVWVSNPVDGNSKTLVLPEYLLENGKSYQFSVTAQGAERITGYPSFTVSSAKISVSS